MTKSTTLLLLLTLACGCLAADNGLCPSPPMGWASWNCFGRNITEDLIRQEADALASSGMRDHGYVFVIVDDGWQGERDSAGNLQPDAALFPSGMKALGDYIHSKGLKFGIYTSTGAQSCLGRVGSLGHEAQDADQFGSWGVDYVKDDVCYSGGLDLQDVMGKMSAALLKQGRPIIFDLDTGGIQGAWVWARGLGNLWRTDLDITADWGSICTIINHQSDYGVAVYASPGHWNDPDMLEVGNGISDSEGRAHFSMWCMLAAPLNAGNDLRSMTPATLSTLTNDEAIAVDQDQLGRQGVRLSSIGSTQVWQRPLADGSVCVVMLNTGESATYVGVSWSSLSLSGPQSARDLWLHEELGVLPDGYSVLVQPHDAVMIKVSPVSRPAFALVSADESPARPGVVVVRFSAPVDVATGGSLSTYSLDSGASVVSATVSLQDQSIVTLITSGPAGLLLVGNISRAGGGSLTASAPIRSHKGKIVSFRHATSSDLQHFPKATISALSYSVKTQAEAQSLIGAEVQTLSDNKVWSSAYTIILAPGVGQENIIYLAAVGRKLRFVLKGKEVVAFVSLSVEIER